jgi:SAM-dependent methyltransferase
MQMDEYQKWPKTPPILTPEQEVIREDFMRLWHEILPESYAMIEKANHDTLLLRRPKASEGICKTLEIGAGIGGHLEFEDLSCQEYTAMELREDWVKTIAQRFPQVKTICGDIEKRLPLEDESFDRIVAIHVLEHLRNLPQALVEIYRLIKPTGYFSVVIPCEGGLAYSFAR